MIKLINFEKNETLYYYFFLKSIHSFIIFFTLEIPVKLTTLNRSKLTT